MTIRLTGDWIKARRILSTAPGRIRRALDVATQQEAQYFRKKVVEGFREQAPGGKQFLPLAPSTLAKRRLRRFRGTKALIVRGDLRNSVNVKREGSGVAFVGVLKTARAKDGRSLANIAEVHEFGSSPIVIRITPKMRKFLAMLGAEKQKQDLKDRGIQPRGRDGRFGAYRYKAAKAGAGFLVVRIPARPFIRPVAEAFFKPSDVRPRFLARVGRALNGEFGQIGIAIPQ